MHRVLKPIVVVMFGCCLAAPLPAEEESAFDHEGEVGLGHETSVRSGEGRKGLFGWKGKRKWGWRKNQDGSSTGESEDVVEGKKGWKLFGRQRVDRRKVEGGHEWRKTHQWKDAAGKLGGKTAVEGRYEHGEKGGRWFKTKSYKGKHGFESKEKVQGKWKLTKDGLVFVSTSTVRLEDGTVIEKEGETILRKTKDGKFQWLVKNKQIGPDGVSVFTTGGESAKDADGKTRWTSHSSGKGPKGKGWSTEGSGSSKWEKGKGLIWKSKTKGKAGKFTWGSKKHRKVELGEKGLQVDGSDEHSSNVAERIKAGLEKWKADAAQKGRQPRKGGWFEKFQKKLEEGKKPRKVKWDRKWKRKKN